MIDIQLLRNDLAGAATRLKSRGYELDGGRFEELEAKRKSLQKRSQELQAKRNSLSKLIGAAKAKGEDASSLMAEVGRVGDDLARLESELADIQAGLRSWLLEIPNPPHESVPPGRSDADNVEVRRWGAPKDFAFTPR